MAAVQIDGFTAPEQSVRVICCDSRARYAAAYMAPNYVNIYRIDDVERSESLENAYITFTVDALVQSMKFAGGACRAESTNSRRRRSPLGKRVHNLRLHDFTRSTLLVVATQRSVHLYDVDRQQWSHAGKLICGYPLSVCVRPPDYMHIGIVDQHCAFRITMYKQIGERGAPTRYMYTPTPDNGLYPTVATWDANGTTLAVGCSNSDIRVYHFDDGHSDNCATLIDKLTGVHENRITTLAFHRRSKRLLASGAADTYVILWLQRGNTPYTPIRHTFDAPPRPMFARGSSNSRTITCVQWHGERLLTVTRDRRLHVVVPFEKTRKHSNMHPSIVVDEEQSANGVCVVPNSERLLTQSFDADCLHVIKVENAVPCLRHLCRQRLLDACIDTKTAPLPPQLRAYGSFEDVIEADQCECKLQSSSM